MFIAMNRFKIARGEEEAFETLWRERDARRWHLFLCRAGAA